MNRSNRSSAHRGDKDARQVPIALICGELRNAFEQLEPEEQGAVLEHLQRMSSEPGWHPEQQRSAQAALEVIGERGKSVEQ